MYTHVYMVLINMQNFISIIQKIDCKKIIFKNQIESWVFDAYTEKSIFFYLNKQ